MVSFSRSFLPSQLWLVLLTLSVDAFTMPPNKPIFTTQMKSSPTSLQAGSNLFDRFTRVVKGNVNIVLRTWEDPEKVMTQALDDMQSDLVTVRQTYAEVSATQRRLIARKAEFDALAADWYRRAQLALKTGNNEKLAREALARREEALQQASATQDQIDSQSASIDKLYEGMQALETKILDAKGKKDQMIARARTAKSTQKVNDMLSGVTGKTSVDAFSRMEEKVMALEAAAEASAEQAKGTLLLSGTKEGEVEAQFRLLETSDAIDAELAKLKENMLLPDKSSVSTKSMEYSTKASTSVLLN